MIKHDEPSILDLFWFLCNLCWKSGVVPDDWRGAVIVTLDKGKGSQIDCASHKAISLISLGSKFYARILARRIQEKSERLLWEAQGGFRPGKGCMDVFSL